MEINIRQERERDYPEVFKLVEEAFKTMKFADGDEQFLVERLRKSAAFVPELSLVAESGGKLIGHVLLTKVHIFDNNTNFECLCLAPVSVLPEFHRKGIGSCMIHYAHEKALELGFTAVLLVGHPEYYPKFGYKKASSFGIRYSFEAPDEACMALELITGALQGKSGTVVFPPEFFV
jgi:predicted N-acetyltransferase YhbS